MENKKNKKYDLEHKRPMFFGVGMMIALSLTLVAFEWRSEIEPVVFPPEPEIEIWAVHLDPVVTKHEYPKPPKKIEPQKKVANQASIIREVKEELYNSEKEDIIDQGADLVDVPLPSIEPFTEEPEEVFLFVEEQPQFPGGEPALLGYIAKNLRYPKAAQRIGVEGRVLVGFIIDKDGSITEVSILKGIGAGCDEEAIRVIESLPNFSPGKQRGKPVKVRMQVPISYKLQ